MLGFIGPLGAQEVVAMLLVFLLLALFFLALPIYLIAKISHLELRVAQLENRQSPPVSP
jgi:hypothetical protein